MPTGSIVGGATGSSPEQPARTNSADKAMVKVNNNKILRNLAAWRPWIVVCMIISIGSGFGVGIHSPFMTRRAIGMKK
jgi:hypothetical protein